MYLYNDLLAHAESNIPVRTGLIGAGKFGSMFLSQVPTTPGLVVSCIADLNPERAQQTCREVGWSQELIDSATFTDDANAMMASGAVDVVVEATGNPAAGLAHARESIRNGLHIVMVNVEADVLAGALLAREAAEAGMNSQMFNSFLDGTKSALEMATIANAAVLAPPDDGLLFPPAGMDDLAHVLRTVSDGGILTKKGQVEVVSSLERDGRPVFKDLRWGVYVVFEAPNDYASACFRQYGMNTDSTGRYSAMYKPFHLIGLELNMSILSAALFGKPTGTTQAFNADVVATLKGS